jgi:DNA-binding MarR family transcriptional regulator
VTAKHKPADPPQSPNRSRPLPPVRNGHYRGESYRPEQSVGYLMRQVVAMMGREMDSRMAQHGLTDAQWKPLLALSYGEGVCAGDMARRVGCDSGAATRLIDRLEDKGLVRRERSDSDRRTVNLFLTEEGRHAAQIVPYVIADVLNGFLVDLSEAEIQQLDQLLRRILAHGRLDDVCPLEGDKS